MLKRCKILVLIFILIPLIGFSQKIHIDIMEFASNFNNGGGAKNKYTYKIWLDGDGGDCRTQDGDPGKWYVLDRGWWSVDFTPQLPYTYKITLEAWEDDGDRCNHNKKDQGHLSATDKYYGVDGDKPSNIYEENWTYHQVSWWDGNYQLKVKTKWYADPLEMKSPVVNGVENLSACGGNDQIYLTCNSFKTVTGMYQWEIDDGTGWQSIGRTYVPSFIYEIPDYNVSIKKVFFRVLPYINGVVCYPDQSNVFSNVKSINIYPKKPLLRSFLPISPKCFLNGDGEIKLDIDGKLGQGVDKYKFGLQYYYGPNVSLSDPYIQSNNYTISNSNLAEGNYLYAGKYTLTIGNVVNDAVYCSNTFDVVITPRPPLVISVDDLKVKNTELNISCNGANDGKISISGSGGTPSYKFSIIQGKDTISTNPVYKANELYIFSELKPDVPYSLLVIDTNGCITGSQPIILKEPDSLKYIVDLHDYPGNVNIPCYGASDTAFVVVSGGVSPYHVSVDDENKVISKNSGSASFSGLVADRKYQIKILDDNDCLLTKDTILSQPTKIEVTKLDLTTCNGEGNGTASISVSGGLTSSGDYSFSLLNDSTEQQKASNNSCTFTNLGSGFYTIRITDRNECIKDTIFLVPESAMPPAVKDTVICKGQVLELNAEDTEYTSYLWKSEFKTISNTSKASMNSIGTYWLSVKNKYGCGSEKSFRLRISDELLQANFAMPSEAFAGDSIVISEISWPVPTKLDWSMPDSFYVYEKDGDLQFIKMPTQPGIYPVKLTAYLGQCWDDIEKKITIFDFSQDSLGGAAGGFSGIKTIGVYPNPNSGDFTVQVFLTDPMQVTIEVRDMFRPVPILSIQDNHKNYYSIPFDLNLVQGTYVLTVRTAQDSQSFKFVVQN